MNLRSEPVSRSLDRKLKMFGFEVPDILAIFLVLTILNLVFGNSQYKLIYTWTPAIFLAIILRVGKRGKPDDFIIHFVKFYTRPNYYCAYECPTKDTCPPKLKEPS